jgi:UDP-N-acetylglucosamine diphosphorylase / glucose-1-phosphate thymidylyltransferase / UDP-N-acetylgalactosamine diphosphorylase / glucosamine-1-phosphate N-acetyltransferase / galactosamine-1-phosphate N-acetyltransferase
MAKIRKYIIEDKRHVTPFNQPARELMFMNQPLFLAQRDALVAYCDTELPIESLESMPRNSEECIVHRDSLYFDEPYIAEFMAQAKKLDTPCRAAFRPSDKAFAAYVLPMSRNVHTVYKQGSENGKRDTRVGSREESISHYEIDLWYFPRGYNPSQPIVPVFVSSGAVEVGYYSVPDYMSNRGDLTHYLTKRTVLSIDSWVHVYFANIIMGIFSVGHRFEERAKSNFYRLKILWKSVLEQTQILSCSELVKIGKNCVIDPTAIIQGPTIIGDNCTIGPGAVVGNCYIGNNVNIAQGCSLMLSVVGDGCFLPFRSSLFMTVLMEHSIVAQNTCLQMCVVGRESFVGAGTTFTDFNLLPTPLKIEADDGSFERIGQPVLGGCVGHNCRLGSGLIMYPGRHIESDVILFATPSRRVIRKNISYDESDHHDLRPEIARLHKRKYPRRVEEIGEQAYLESW